MEINGETNDQISPSRLSRKKVALYLCLTWGILFGALTFAVGPISSISDNPIVGAVQTAAMVLMVPGLIGAGAFAGNVHAFSLVPAAIINGIVNFGLSWIVLSLFLWIRRRYKRSQYLS
jgi:hypothetical protein